ncbi:MAG: hypothetical protein IIC50_06225 [Planctomycetes bacterium]|nr:hypothetical protein [Planctomycetota bacterium]
MSFGKSLILLVLVIAGYAVVFLDDETIRRLSAEDGLVETVGALCFLGAALVFFLIYRKNRKIRSNRGSGSRSQVAVLLLGLFFLVCFLEEISWGQRVFGVGTPEALADANRQGEINIHNLNWFHGKEKDGSRKSFLKLLINGDRLFSVFWLVFGVIVPLLDRYSQRCRTLFSDIRMPVLPVAFSVFFVLNYIISESMPALESLNYPTHPWVEIKEANCAFLLMLGSVCLFLRQPDERQCASRPRELSAVGRSVPL